MFADPRYEPLWEAGNRHGTVFYIPPTYPIGVEAMESFMLMLSLAFNDLKNAGWLLSYFMDVQKHGSGSKRPSPLRRPTTVSKVPRIIPRGIVRSRLA